jgi:hypothetical protein
MNTTTETGERERERERETPVKTKAPISHYIVTKRGLPCALVTILRGQRAGVLLPQQCGVQAFRRRARANAAINRTQKCVRNLNESLIRDWLVEKQEAIRELLLPGEFKIAQVRYEK